MFKNLKQHLKIQQDFFIFQACSETAISFHALHPHLSVTAGGVDEFQLTLLQEVKFQLNAQQLVSKPALKHHIFPQECQHQIQELTMRGNNSITVSMMITI